MATTKAEVEVKIGNGPAIKSMGELKKQLKEANFEALALSETFGKTSKEAISAAKRVAELKDAIGDAKAFTEGFNPDAKFTALSGAIQGVVGGFTALQGATALFGDKSKEVEETLAKVQGALALSQGINSLLEAKDAFKNLGAVVQEFAVVQKALNFIEQGQLKTNEQLIASKEADATATEGQTTAQATLTTATFTTANAMKVLRGALIATGIGALIVAVGALIPLIMDWVSGTEDSKKANEELNAELERQNQLLEDNINAINYVKDIKVLNAKLAGKSEKELREIEAQSHTDRMAEYNSQIDKLTEIRSKIDISNEEGQKSYENYSKSIDKIYKDLYKEIDDNTKANLETQLKDKEEANKKEQELLDKKAQKQKEYADKVKQANEQLKKETKSLNDATFLEQIKDEDARAKAKLDQEYKNKQEEIKASIANETIKQEALKALKAKYDADTIILQEQLNKKLEDANKEALKQANDLANENYLNTITNETNRALEKIRIDNEARVEEINGMKISEFEKTALLQQEEIKRQGLIQQVKAQVKLDEANKKLEEANNDELDFQTRLQKIQEREQMENQITFANDADRTKYEKENKDARVQLADDEHKAKVQFLQDIGNAMGALSDLIGKDTAVGKGLAVAQATINTFLGATEVLKAKSTLPEPLGTISKIANVTAIIATGLKSVKSILATKVPGGGGGGSAPSTPSISAPIPPQLGSTALNQQMINNLQSANATQRAFVLESDVTGQQERIQRLNRAARIS